MKKSLFDISDDMLAIRDLFDGFEEEGGEIDDPEVEALIDRLFEASKENEEEFDRKVDSYIWLIKELKSEAGIQKQEAGRLADEAKKKTTQAERLENRLGYIFKKLGFRERKTKYHNPKFVMPGGKQALELDLSGWAFTAEEEGKPLPECYVKTMYDIDKEKVREELENGTELGFARLKEKEEKLRIK